MSKTALMKINRNFLDANLQIKPQEVSRVLHSHMTVSHTVKYGCRLRLFFTCHPLSTGGRNTFSRYHSPQTKRALIIFSPATDNPVL